MESKYRSKNVQKSFIFSKKSAMYYFLLFFERYLSMTLAESSYFCTRNLKLINCFKYLR